MSASDHRLSFGTGRNIFKHGYQVTLIGVITVATLVSVVVGVTWLERRTVAASGETVSIMAAEVADKLDLLLKERIGDAQFLSESLAISGGTSVARHHILTTFHQAYPQYLWIGVADPEGHMTETTDLQARRLNVRASHWFQAVRQRHAGFYIGDIAPDEVSQGAETVSFSAPIVDHRVDVERQSIRGVVTTRVSAEQLEKLVTEAIGPFQRRTSFFHTVEYKVLREDGVVFIDSDVSRSGQVNLVRRNLPSVRLAASGESGYVEEEHLVRHVPVLTGYARLRRHDGDVESPKWTVLLRVDRAEVVAPVHRFFWTVGAAAVLIVGPLIGWLVYITRRAQVEWQDAQEERARARANEHWLQTILEVEPEGVLVTDHDRRVLQINPAGCALFDAAFPEEILGRDIAQWVHEDDRRAYEDAHAAALQGRGVLTSGRLLGLSGQSRWFEMTSVLLPGAQGASPSVLSVTRDITDQKYAQRRQALQHAVAKVLAEASTVEQAIPELLRVIGSSLEWQVGTFWLVQEKTRLLRCTQTWSAQPSLVEEFFEASRRETFSSDVGFPGRCWARGEPLWEPDVLRDRAFVRTAAASLNGLHAGCVFPVWLRASVFGIMEFFSREIHPRDADLLRTLATIGGQIGLFLERAEVEAALRETESRTRLIIDTALDAIVTMDPDGIITEWNAQAELLFGWQAHEAIGKDLADTIIPADHRAAHRAGLARYLKTGQVSILGRLVEVQACHRDGRMFPAELSIAHLRLDDTVVFSAFIRDISQRKESEQALSSYAQQLERSNYDLDEALGQARAATEAKSAFLATMSHEIRTPMNGVIGMTGLLLDTELTAEQREYGEAVRSCGDHLLTIINDILDFSKIEAGKLNLEIIEFDLRHAVEDSLDLLAERASSKQLNLACLFHADVLTALRGDPGRVRQVLTNLVGNAIKFTEQGDVVVQVRLASQQAGAVLVRFDVTDTGIGLSEAQQARLFQAFSQADGSTTRKYGGTGLGLAICKRLVELMGGEIGVASQPGAGSTFWFTARFERQGAAGDPVVPEALSVRGKRVLIVDDKPINCRILALLMKKWEVESTVISDHSDVLPHLHEQARSGLFYDAAIIDADLAKSDGLQLAQSVIATKGALRVILLTSVGRRGDAKAAKAMGISAYLTKPIRESQLVRCLAMVSEQPAVSSAGERMPPNQELVTRHTLAEAVTSSGMKILLAEDNIINQKVAVRMFERLGHRVDVVANGREAVEALSRLAYDLVFMDCQMPEMDGFEAAADIRRREAGARHTIVIAMTANAMQGDRERCLRAGMDDYVTKPITTESLAAVFERWRRPAVPVRVPEAAPHEGATIDPLVFDGLRVLSDEDDPGFLTRLVRHFLADTPDKLALLGTACRKGSAEEVQRIAHSLKGSASNLGALGLARLCDRVVAGAAQGLAVVPELLTELELEFHRVREQLEQDLREAA